MTNMTVSAGRIWAAPKVAGWFAAVLLAMIAGLAMSPAYGEEVGPAVGATIPDGFAATDQTGAERTLADLAGEEGLVLFFVRSADWCPICKAQLAELHSRHSELTTAGYQVAVVTTDNSDTLAGIAQEEEFAFTMLADPESELIQAWDLVDPQFTSGRRAGLPYPSTFILGSDGVVKAKLLEVESYGKRRAYAKRVSFDDIAAAALAARGS